MAMVPNIAISPCSFSQLNSCVLKFSALMHSLLMKFCIQISFEAANIGVHFCFAIQICFAELKFCYVKR